MRFSYSSSARAASLIMWQSDRRPKELFFVFLLEFELAIIGELFLGSFARFIQTVCALRKSEKPFRK